MMKRERNLHRNIYVCGNPLVAADALAIDVAREIERDFPSVSFVHLDPNEEISERDIILLDVAEGISKVMIFNDVDQFIAGKKISLHDYDTAFSLQLMKKTGLLKKVCIIAIPLHYPLKKACRDVKHYLHLTLKK